MEIKKIRIALDGPSGAGKSTIAKMVAEKLGIVDVFNLYLAHHLTNDDLNVSVVDLNAL